MALIKAAAPAWADRFASALSRLDMPTSARPSDLVDLGLSLHRSQGHLTPEAAAALERLEWPPLEAFPNGALPQAAKRNRSGS